MSISRGIYAASLVLGIVASACGASQATPITGTTEVTSSHNEADATVVERLASARCDQEQACANIGPNAKFASRSICMEQVRGDIGNHLNGYNCPLGLNQGAVDACMAAIRSERCEHPFDTLSRYDRCRSGAMCMR